MSSTRLRRRSSPSRRSRSRANFDVASTIGGRHSPNRYDQVAHDAEYPIEVENYLTANWARRLGRDMPEPSLQLFGQRKIGGSWIAQLTANESYQALVERDLVLGKFDGDQAASVALPESPWTPLETTAPAKPVDVEPLATHVPRECFYERFGSFRNYLWYRDFLHHWQNDLGNMVTLRSINHTSRDRLQDQLAVHESNVGRVMGPKVVRDVCFMGFDYYMRDGAALGILFQANNNLLLGQNFNSERSKAIEKYPSAKLETVSIAGHDVSYLSTPDGRLRSYYAVDGDFHLITTCRRLVERFYAAPNRRHLACCHRGVSKHPRPNADHPRRHDLSLSVVAVF